MRGHHSTFVALSLIAGMSLNGCRTAGANKPAQGETAPEGSASGYSQAADPELRAKAGANDARAQRELAFRAMREGRAKEALDWVERAIALEPGSSDGFNIRGMVHAGSRRFGAAERDFRHAATLAPNKAGPHVNLGRVLVDQKRYQGAAEAFEAALKADPKSVDAAILAGDAWRLFGSSINGKRFYRKALEIKPDEPRALAGLGIVLTNSGHLQEAVAKLTRARELGIDSPYTRGYLGFAHALRAQTPADADLALQILLSARRDGQSESHIWGGIGLAYLTKGELKTAERELLEGVKRYPDLSGLHHTLGEVYALTGRPEKSAAERSKSAELVRKREAEANYLQAIATRPTDVAARLRYVEWLLSRNEGHRAAGPLLEGLRYTPNDAKLAAALKRVSEKTRNPSLLAQLGSK